MDDNAKRQIDATAKDRRLAVVVFALFFSWLLAFPFEGQVLYAVTGYHGISAHSYIYGAMAAHFVGLAACGFLVRNMKNAKRLILFSIAFCAAATGVFFLPPSFLWTVALYSSALLVGACVAAWGFFFKGCTPKDGRIRTMADCLIFSNLLMILINMTAIHISPQTGLAASVVVLVTAFLFALRLPGAGVPTGGAARQGGEASAQESSGSGSAAGIIGPLAFLCLFIVVITINSGLMYQVVGPAYSGLEWLTSWYWAVPYIAALIVMRNLPRTANRSYILYVAIAMIGFSFVIFLVPERTWTNYLAVNTLLMGACGIYDLFWWSILGGLLDFGKNPAKILGAGLAANVLGVLLGGAIGNAIIDAAGESAQNHIILAFGVVFVTLIMLPPLNTRLTRLLTNHAYLTAFKEMPAKEQAKLIGKLDLSDKLTAAESKVARLLVSGKTYKAIAEELGVTANAVKFHAGNIYAKTGVGSKTELASLILKKPNPR